MRLLIQFLPVFLSGGILGWVAALIHASKQGGRVYGLARLANKQLKRAAFYRMIRLPAIAERHLDAYDYMVYEIKKAQGKSDELSPY